MAGTGGQVSPVRAAACGGTRTPKDFVSRRTEIRSPSFAEGFAEENGRWRKPPTVVGERADGSGVQASAAATRKAEKSILIFLLDTCVLSESMRPHKDAFVVSWLSVNELRRQYISALTIGELYYGAERLSEGRRRRELQLWVRMVEEDYAGRIVPLDHAVAAIWGRLRAASPNGQTVDMQLAATALAHGFTFVTRNVADFRFDGLKVVNPWEA
jgi:predicted nucleic acid-binding protein